MKSIYKTERLTDTKQIYGYLRGNVGEVKLGVWD